MDERGRAGTDWPMKAGEKMRAISLMPILAIALAMVFSIAEAKDEKPSLEEAIANVKIPPDWFESVKLQYSTSKPWKDARLEIRRLLALGGEKAKAGIKLTYLYLQKDDIGDGHEYPMYLFLGGEYAWALQIYKEFLESQPDGHTHAYRSLASCYVHFGEYEKAIEILNTAMERLPEPPWQIANEADIHDGIGDIYAEMGDIEKAKLHYSKAIEIYPTSNQPYGRHLLYRRVNKIQAKLDLLEHQSIKSGQLKDGVYEGESLGYGQMINVIVTVKDGKIADIKLRHKEKIEQNATVIIPQRIIEKQSLNVDGITGATVTCQAIVEGTFAALKKASLE